MERGEEQEVTPRVSEEARRDRNQSAASQLKNAASAWSRLALTVHQDRCHCAHGTARSRAHSFVSAVCACSEWSREPQGLLGESVPLGRPRWMGRFCQGSPLPSSWHLFPSTRSLNTQKVADPGLCLSMPSDQTPDPAVGTTYIITPNISATL